MDFPAWVKLNTKDIHVGFTCDGMVINLQGDLWVIFSMEQTQFSFSFIYFQSRFTQSLCDILSFCFMLSSKIVFIPFEHIVIITK